MSLLSAILLPLIEKHLVEAEPQIAEFALKQLHGIGSQLVTYVEAKLGMNPQVQVAPAAPIADASQEQQGG